MVAAATATPAPCGLPIGDLGDHPHDYLHS
jgi:hypothetical protein